LEAGAVWESDGGLGNPETGAAPGPNASLGAESVGLGCWIAGAPCVPGAAGVACGAGVEPPDGIGFGATVPGWGADGWVAGAAWRGIDAVGAGWLGGVGWLGGTAGEAVWALGVGALPCGWLTAGCCAIAGGIAALAG
jgi:hypothetical protein